MSKSVSSPDNVAVAAVLADVRLPLENVEFTIEQYLLDNGTRLDTETRCLLAGVRDCVRRVVGTARNIGPPH